MYVRAHTHTYDWGKIISSSRIIYAWDLNHMFTNFAQSWVYAEHAISPA